MMLMWNLWSRRYIHFFAQSPFPKASDRVRKVVAQGCVNNIADHCWHNNWFWIRILQPFAKILLERRDHFCPNMLFLSQVTNMQLAIADTTNFIPNLTESPCMWVRFWWHRFDWRCAWLTDCSERASEGGSLPLSVNASSGNGKPTWPAAWHFSEGEHASLSEVRKCWVALIQKQRTKCNK